MMNKPDKDKLLQMAELLYSRIGLIDDMIVIVGDSMMPTFKPGSLVAISDSPYPELINWAEYYYIIDTNGQGRVCRVYPGEIPDRIKLVTDYPDQERYPPVTISWNQVKEIYKVRAAIVKY